MAGICRITILAFIFGDITKGPENGYDNWDLENGIEGVRKGKVAVQKENFPREISRSSFGEN